MEEEKIITIIDTMDWISQLPEFIVDHILSLLDSPVHRVRMSALSKKWFSLTASFPILNFIIDDILWALRATGVPLETCSYSTYVKDKFFKYVDYTTSRFCEQNVSAHTFNLMTVLQEPKEVEIIDKCVRLILKQGVKVLVICIMDDWPFLPIGVSRPLPVYHLPSTLLPASSLTSLKLCSCVLPLFLTASSVKFKSLKLLHLECVRIDEKVIMCLTAGSPVLEEFNVLHCYGFKIFYAHGLQNLQKLWIYFKCEVERIDIEAPSLCDVYLVDWERRGAPSMNLALCKKLITLIYDGYPALTPNSFADLSSISPYIKNLFLNLPRQCNNLKLSSHSLQTLVVNSLCDLDEIDISAPNLAFFEYNGTLNGCCPLVRDSLEPKPVFECYPTAENGADAIWFEKLRRFLGKNVKFKVLKLGIRDFFNQGLIDVEKLKAIQSPPFELEHCELELAIGESSIYEGVVDAVLTCCRPRSLSLRSDFSKFDSEEWSHVVKFTCTKLLQQEDEGQTNIHFLLSSSSKAEKNFSDLNSLLTALPRHPLGEMITFTKEEVVHKYEDGTIKGMRMCRLDQKCRVPGKVRFSFEEISC